MKSFVICLILILPAIVLGFDCKGNVDGVYDVGCKVFVQCINGAENVVECPVGLVFNKNTKLCDLPTRVPAPCGNVMDCSNKKDARYADLTKKCTSYYTCNGGIYFGHNFCPGGNVFNEKLQTCDWKYDTEPPCGTKTT
ncbi:hypothetical protein SNE40_006496 [Patella caerulea]|uniref:Chitin-binding type-2 domain-containing protein n=1 Tax=Patella caerulea TaxID=87958 RepID=A0AAN8PVZ6_PATCE